MTIDPLNNTAALHEAYHGRCPRHVLGYPDNPDAVDHRDDAHLTDLAQKLIDRAKEMGPLLCAFPDSDFVESDSIV